jgi:repressor LexA
MIDEHIQDGDYVVVNNKNSADNGQMVIALIDGNSATLKRYYREPGGWIRLQPSNDDVAPIRAREDDVLVQGIVVGVLRKY